MIDFFDNFNSNRLGGSFDEAIDRIKPWILKEANGSTLGFGRAVEFGFGLGHERHSPGFDSCTYDSIVVVGWLWGQSNLASLLGLLNEGGNLVFVEPTATFGLVRKFQLLARPWWRRSLGFTFDSDVPLNLRAAGFEIVTLVRFTAGRTKAESYCAGVARVSSR